MNWVLYASRGHNRDDILAIEPDPQNRAQLHANLFLNALTDRVRVLEFAATNRAGPVQLFIGPTRNRGISRLDAGEGSQFHGSFAFRGEVEVRGARMDDELQFRNECLIVKMDVEGHEDKVIEGMTELLKVNEGVCQIEINKSKFEQTRSLMASIGYVHLGVIGEDHYFTNVSRCRSFE